MLNRIRFYFKSKGTIFLAAVLIICSFIGITRIGYSVDIDPWDREAVSRPRADLGALCWCIVHKTIEPCAFLVRMEMRVDQQCTGSPGVKCGHVATHHTPSDPMQVTNGTLINGGLTENIGGTLSFLLPRKEQQLFYPFYYYSGRIMGDVEVRVLAWNQSPNHRFIPPCEDINTCTVPLNVKVGFQYLQELPDAPFPPPYPFYDWTRCGTTAGCQSGIDSAYSWQSHPTVHWGAEEFLSALDCLARTWYFRCNHELAITDISLPGGGLLDINHNWNAPHIRHRLGTDADLVGVSIPATGICGDDIPTITYDQTWNTTPLQRLKVPCNLLQMRRDPGHVCQYCRGGY